MLDGNLALIREPGRVDERSDRPCGLKTFWLWLLNCLVDDENRRASGRGPAVVDLVIGNMIMDVNEELTKGKTHVRKLGAQAVLWPLLASIGLPLRQ